MLSTTALGGSQHSGQHSREAEAEVEEQSERMQQATGMCSRTQMMRVIGTAEAGSAEPPTLGAWRQHTGSAAVAQVSQSSSCPT